MMEIILYGRGGQGGVTLAKLIAQAYFLRGQHAQAFGVYAAERSGAPVQAFVRIDDREICNHNEIREPDHVIVLDWTLVGASVTAGMKPNGWLILNSPREPGELAETFPGRQAATIDATSIALTNGLGTRTVPIVNTTLFGAAARVLGLSLGDVEATLAALKFGGGNVASARRAFEEVRMAALPGQATAPAVTRTAAPLLDLLDTDVGARPRLRTGAWATRQPHRRHLEPPCNHACPAGNDVQAFVAAVAAKEEDAALAILLETSPFPGVCGRVCPAPCMNSCNRSSFDEAINVRELERFAADRGERVRARAVPRAERIAIVGSGPAGLSAAYHLARLGYDVTIFEGGEELGGVLRTGIPTYRLPRSVLDREIEFILSHGVDVRRGHWVRRSDLLELSRTFDAVFVATGLQEARTLELGVERGQSRGRIEQGIEFLDRARRGAVKLPGEHILVVGGGNTAVDAARTARRLGAAQVHILYRRTREQMPAIGDEIDAAIQEGIQLDELVLPIRLHENRTGLLLTCQRMRLAGADESGRAMPIPETTDDAFFDMRCDRIILALGQSSDLSILPEGSQIQDQGVFLGLSGAPVFWGGDFATQEGTVAAAIGNGRVAALHIHRTLSGEDLLPRPAEPVADASMITRHAFTLSPQRRGAVIELPLRRHSFDEVHQGLPFENGNASATLEAQRCFSCGVCNSCDRCRQFCPEGIIRRDQDEYLFDYDYCKGCGVCAAQCPRGVIYMTEL